jgi:hypothetical protein
VQNQLSGHWEEEAATSAAARANATAPSTATTTPDPQHGVITITATVTLIVSDFHLLLLLFTFELFLFLTFYGLLLLRRLTPLVVRPTSMSIGRCVGVIVGTFYNRSRSRSPLATTPTSRWLRGRGILFRLPVIALRMCVLPGLVSAA